MNPKSDENNHWLLNKCVQCINLQFFALIINIFASRPECSLIPKLEQVHTFQINIKSFD
jgi:hypothetical protein